MSNRMRVGALLCEPPRISTSKRVSQCTVVCRAEPPKPKSGTKASWSDVARAKSKIELNCSCATDDSSSSGASPPRFPTSKRVPQSPVVSRAEPKPKSATKASWSEVAPAKSEFEVSPHNCSCATEDSSSTVAVSDEDLTDKDSVWSETSDIEPRKAGAIRVGRVSTFGAFDLFYITDAETEERFRAINDQGIPLVRDALVEFRRAADQSSFAVSEEVDDIFYFSKLSCAEYGRFPRAQLLTVVQYPSYEFPCFLSREMGFRKGDESVLYLIDGDGRGLWTLWEGISADLKSIIGEAIADEMNPERFADKTLHLICKICNQRPLGHDLAPFSRLVYVQVLRLAPRGDDPKDTAVAVEKCVEQALPTHQISPQAPLCYHGVSERFSARSFQAWDSELGGVVEDAFFVDAEYLVFATPATPAYLPVNNARDVMDKLWCRPASVWLLERKLPMLSMDFDELFTSEKKFLCVLLVFRLSSPENSPEVLLERIKVNQGLANNVRLTSKIALQLQTALKTLGVNSPPINPLLPDEKIEVRKGRYTRKLLPCSKDAHSLLTKLRVLVERHVALLLTSGRNEPVCLVRERRLPSADAIARFGEFYAEPIRQLLRAPLSASNLADLYHATEKSATTAAEFLRCVALPDLAPNSEYKVLVQGKDIKDYFLQASNVAPFASSNRDLVALCNKILLMNKFGFLTERLDPYVSDIKARLRDWVFESHRLQSARKTTMSANLEIRRTAASVATFQNGGFVCDFFVAALDKHNILFRSRTTAFVLSGQIVAPVCYNSTYDWSPADNPTKKNFMFINGGKMRLERFTKVQMLCRAVPDNGALQTRVTAIRTCSLDCANHTALCFQDIHSEASAACWLDRRFYRRRPDLPEYDNATLLRERQYPAIVQQIASTAFQCQAASRHKTEVSELPSGAISSYKHQCKNPTIYRWQNGSLEQCLRSAPTVEAGTCLCMQWGQCRFESTPRCRYYGIRAGVCLNGLKYVLKETGKPCHQRCGKEHWNIDDYNKHRNDVAKTQIDDGALAHFAVFSVVTQDGLLQWHTVIRKEPNFHFQSKWTVLELNCNHKSHVEIMQGLNAEQQKFVKVMLYPIMISDLEVLLSFESSVVVDRVAQKVPHYFKFQIGETQLATVKECREQQRNAFKGFSVSPRLWSLELDEVQINCVAAAVFREEHVVLTGTAGTGKSRVNAAILGFRERLFSKQTRGPNLVYLHLFLTHGNESANAFFHKAEAEYGLRPIRVYSTAVSKGDCLTCFGQIDAGTSTSIIVVSTVNKVLSDLRNFPSNFVVATLVIDEAQSACDPQIFTLFDKFSVKFDQRNCSPYRFVNVCSGDAYQKTYAGENVLTRSLKRSLLSRLKHCLDTKVGDPRPHPAKHVWVLAKAYRAQDDLHYYFDPYNAFNPAPPVHSGTVPQLMLVPSSSTPTPLPDAMLYGGGARVTTMHNPEMCQLAIELLGQLAQGFRNSSTMTVSILSAYSGDIVYLERCIPAAIRSLFSLVAVHPVDSSIGGEADIVIMIATKTHVSSKGKPEGLSFVSKERVKTFCTRHKRFFALIGDLDWLMKSYDNSLDEVTRVITAHQLSLQSVSFFLRPYVDNLRQILRVRPDLELCLQQSQSRPSSCSPSPSKLSDYLPKK